MHSCLNLCNFTIDYNYILYKYIMINCKNGHASCMLDISTGVIPLYLQPHSQSNEARFYSMAISLLKLYLMLFILHLSCIADSPD